MVYNNKNLDMYMDISHVLQIGELRITGDRYNTNVAYRTRSRHGCLTLRATVKCPHPTTPDRSGPCLLPVMTGPLSVTSTLLPSDDKGCIYCHKLEIANLLGCMGREHLH